MKFPNSSFEYLNRIKLSLYQSGLMSAIAILFVLYWQRYKVGPLEAEERFVLPTVLVFCIMSLILFRVYKDRYLYLFETITCILLVAYDWLHYVAGLNKARQLDAPLGFDRFLIWLPIIYAIFFIYFPIKQATIASGIFLLSLAIPAGHHLWQTQGHQAFPEDFSMLASILASGIVFTLIFLRWPP